MEFQFHLSSIFPEPLMIVGKDVTSRKVDGTLNTSSTSSQFYKKGNSVDLDPSGRICLGEVIDSLGAASARAQGLLQAVTTHTSLRKSDNHVIYFLTRCSSPSEGVSLYSGTKAKDETSASGDVCLGYLKVGRRQLYLTDRSGKTHVVVPLCLLDFYVHEDVQRQGHGATLFNAMLKNEDSKAEMVAIDRPSHRMLSFMAKHFALTDPLKQSNSFVVYDGFFATIKDAGDGDTSAASDANGNSTQDHTDDTGAPATNSGAPEASNGARNSRAPGNTTAAGTVTASTETRNLHDHHRLW